jgi:hypothetical protein
MPKRPDPYYQTNITRRNLVIPQEKKQLSDSQNTIIIIALPLLPPFIPESLESRIPAKYLDYKPKTLDLPNFTEPEPNT